MGPGYQHATTIHNHSMVPVKQHWA